MTEWQALIEQHAAAYQMFLETVAKLRPRQRRKGNVSGEWSAKDIAAHFIHWELEAAARLKALMEGPTPAKDYDTDTINAQTVAAYEHLSWDIVMQRLDDAHRQLQGVVAGIGPDRVMIDARFQQWIEGRIADFRLHTEQIRKKFRHK